MAWASGIYQGFVRHRRFSPKQHEFRYSLFMMYLDLDELPKLLAQHKGWSESPWSPARFKRADYFGDPNIPLDQAVRQRVNSELNLDLNGRVCVLTHVRYLGFVFNPISVYYCFDQQDKLQAMLLEVTNTPWGERRQYALRCDPEQRVQRISFQKTLHVSPFNPMAMQYRWNNNCPGDGISIHMDADLSKGDKIFDATLNLKRKEISQAALNRTLIAFPLMTLKVVASIYWEAMRLLIKRVPLFKHPSDSKTESPQSEGKLG